MQHRYYRAISLVILIITLTISACSLRDATENMEPVDRTYPESTNKPPSIILGDDVNTLDTTNKVDETEQITESETTDPVQETTEPVQETTEPVNVEIPTYSISDIEHSGRDIITYGTIPSDTIQSLETLLDAYPKNISLAVYSLDGSKAVVYNGKQQYFSACTVKVPWVIWLCKAIDDETVNPNTYLTYEERHYQGGSGVIRKYGYGKSYKISTLINYCLSISDNCAYRMIIEQVGRQNFKDYISNLPLKYFNVPDYSIWCSQSIVTDFLVLWQDAYNYMITDTAGAKLFKESCTNTKWNYGSFTVKNYDYSHKSGDNFGSNCVYNDAGLIWSENLYVYAVFTKSEGTDYDTECVNKIMDILHKEFQSQGNTTD